MGDATRRKAYFCRLFTEATLGGMAFEVIDRPSDDPQAALLAATEGYIPVRASTPDELRAALNVIAADFAVHLGAAAPAAVEATAEELRQVGAHWLAHVISLVTDATAAMRADGTSGAVGETGDGAAV
ncbi:MAG TPA: hypothetical protein VIL85_28510 [Thermomicrobiales bacterium]|jgi:hypothetical protein